MIIDCDCHNYWSTAEVLLPYLDDYHYDFFTRGEQPGPRGSFPNANRPYLHPEGFKRMDINPETQEDNYRLMKEKHLDRYQIDYAIMTGDEAMEASTIANPFYAHALVRAYNDWQIDEWLARDSRLKGSIMIAPQAPELAAEEIRRLGHRSDMVQVLSSHGAERPYGHPIYHPIYEACAEVGLPFAIHLGGQGGINSNAIAAGPTRYFWESHALLPQSAMTHVASMIAEGVFEKWPELYFIVIECGVAWVAPILWRLDADYRALRKETPWLKMLPSEYFRRNVRFTTQPLEQPETGPQHLWNILEAMYGQETLMFASDYPHWDYDDVEKLHIPPKWRDDILGNNALSVYTRLQPAVQTRVMG